jgi:hypothetical protein
MRPSDDLIDLRLLCGFTRAHEVQCPDGELAAIEALVAQLRGCAVLLRRDVEDILGLRHRTNCSHA